MNLPYYFTWSKKNVIGDSVKYTPTFLKCRSVIHACICKYMNSIRQCTSVFLLKNKKKCTVGQIHASFYECSAN